MAFDIFITLFLVVLNGFFVAAEFAIVKVRSSQIEVRENINKNIAATAKSIVNNLDAYLAATQLGITLASLGLGWVGESVTTNILLKTFHAMGLELSESAAHNLALPIAFATITVLHIVFGELAPKSIAIRFPSSTTFAIALPLKIFYLLFRPFIWSLNGVANFILRMIGIRPIHGGDIHTEEELKMIISESHEGGAIEETERDLIRNVFDFDDRRVWDIQTLRKNVTPMEVNLSLDDAINFAITEGYSRYPVCDGSLDEIAGIIYTKDLMKTMVATKKPESIRPLLRKANFIPESRLIKDLLKEFQKKHIQMAVVTNEIGEVSGIVTMEDILEELVGEIQDEYDNETPYVEKTARNTFIVNAHTNLSDINKYLPYRLEESDHYETLSGLIAYCFPQELNEQDKLTIDKYEVRILKMYRNSAETVELTVTNNEDDSFL
ncbi:MAG TPA: hemolysin family protein [Flavipsychrobacter sp.]|nr:hemolysin family protein [Flavipsychrobacter sp.]